MERRTISFVFARWLGSLFEKSLNLQCLSFIIPQTHLAFFACHLYIIMQIVTYFFRLDSDRFLLFWNNLSWHCRCVVMSLYSLFLLDVLLFVVYHRWWFLFILIYFRLICILATGWLIHFSCVFFLLLLCLLFLTFVLIWTRTLQNKYSAIKVFVVYTYTQPFALFNV